MISYSVIQTDENCWEKILNTIIYPELNWIELNITAFICELKCLIIYELLFAVWSSEIHVTSECPYLCMYIFFNKKNILEFRLCAHKI